MSVEKFLFGLKRLFLSSTLVNQLEDYTALPLTQDTCKYNGDDFVISRGNTLYSKGRNPTSPEVGDIIVKYTFVAKGKHTLVSKFLVDKGFVPFEGELNPPSSFLLFEVDLPSSLPLPPSLSTV
jgi:hypothetical protein